MSIIVNLGLLSYFKYSYFFVDVFNSVFNTNLEAVNILASWTNDLTGSSFDISRIILPVGISFFTFQTISYSVDVYRNKVKPVSNIIDFGFYVSVTGMVVIICFAYTDLSISEVNLRTMIWKSLKCEGVYLLGITLIIFPVAFFFNPSIPK